MSRAVENRHGCAAPPGWLGWLLVLLCSVQPAWAKGDFRLEDRFFFALYGGTSISNIEQIALTQNATSVIAKKQDGLGPLFGMEVSFWPCDYAALGLVADIFTVPPPAAGYTALTADLGLELLLALPLRYVQPYGGVWGGLRMSWLGKVGSGALLGVHPIAGLNFYINRNLRLFAQWQYVPLSYEATGDNASVAFTNASTHLVGAGLRWSPDFFHSARAAMKFDLIWWSTLLTVAAWGVGSWIGSAR